MHSGFFFNPAPIIIPDSGPASPYPSNIVVAAQGTVVKVTVTLRSLIHFFSDDLDFLLVGPKGRTESSGLTPEASLMFWAWMSPSTTTRRIRCPTARKLFPARTARRTTAPATRGRLPLRRLWAAQRSRSSMGPTPTGRGVCTSLTTQVAITAWSTPAGS